MENHRKSVGILDDDIDTDIGYSTDILKTKTTLTVRFKSSGVRTGRRDRFRKATLCRKELWMVLPENSTEIIKALGPV